MEDIDHVPLPSCVMRVVQETFLDPNGTFKGFEYSLLVGLENYKSCFSLVNAGGKGGGSNWDQSIYMYIT